MSEKPKSERGFVMRAVIGRVFGGGARNKLSILEEAQVQSPFRTIMKNFLSRRLTQIGLTLFTVILLSSLILPFIFPMDLHHQDVSQQHMPPGFSIMRYPRELRGNVAQISVGSNFAVGISNDGNLYIWGILSDRLRNIPEDMGRIVDISAGLDHVLALNDQGEVFTWGNNRFNLSNFPPMWEFIMPNIVAVKAGFQISTALDDRGNLHVWGNEGMTSIVTRGLTGRIVDWDVNPNTAVALMDDGRVEILSRRNLPISDVPEHIQGNVVAVAASDRHVAAVLNDGTITAWGTNVPDILNVPEHIQGRAVSVSAGRNHFSVILDDGTVAAWGENALGQADAPRSVTNVEFLAVDYFQNYAVDSDGNIHTWGLRGYLFGTDQFGRDVFLRLIQGGRLTLFVGAVAVIISTVIGIFMGGISGYFGGKVDMFCMRFAEVVNSIPFLPLAIILSWSLGNRVGPIGRMYLIMGILGVLSWPVLMRLVRGQMLQARENDYVTAARSLGVKEGAIIFKHIFPNIIAVVIVQVAISLALSMLTESTLSFLGFGIEEPLPTWGNMLYGTINSIVIRTYWWRWVFPGLFLFTAVLSINIIGDGLREAIDPKAQER
jgi:peptide/nickel transport system permease protein